MSTAAIARKKKLVDELKEKIDSANVLVVSDYRSITVKDITELRKKLHKEKAEFKVIKNTLLTRAMEAAGYADLKDHFKGPTALLLGYDEPVAPLKSLVEFIKELQKGEIKAGVLEKSIVEKKALEEISKLPPKEVLIGKVVGGFKAPLYGLVNVLQGNLRKLVYALKAIQDKKGGEK